MKKCTILIALCLLLTGCGAQQTMETISDDYVKSLAAPMQLRLTVPEDAAVQTMGNDEAGKLYLCDGYTVTVQTFASGDLNSTVRSLCGFDTDHLTVIKTSSNELDQYRWVWTSIGETGEQVGKAMVLDDGNYHYALTVMAEAATAGQLDQIWQEIFSSVTLSID